MSNMLQRQSFRLRLFLAFAFVAVVTALSITVIMRILIPSAFADHLSAMDRFANPNGQTMWGDLDPRRAATSALKTALPIAVATSLLIAGLIGALTSSRILRPIQDMQRATRRLAAGELDERAPIPPSNELGALAEDINHLGATLQAAEIRRTRLIGDVMHELRTPLTVIDGYTEALLDQKLQPSQEIFAAVSDEVAKLTRLINDLRMLSIIDEHHELHMHAEDLKNIAGSVCDRLRSQFVSNEVTLILNAERADVCCDRSRVEQVVTNLLGNALTYTPRGGTVTVTTEEANKNGVTTARLIVSDTGIGIAASDLDHIFERFYRVDGVHRPPGGSGIGLNIAQSLALQHGGTITATSPGVNCGSTFTVVLPIGQRPTEDSQIG